MREYFEEEQPNETEIRKMKDNMDSISRAVHAQKEGIHKPGFIQLKDVDLPLLLENFNRVLPNL